ncbi:MAG: aldo/keto reductase [Ignavibacterium sp.]|uniref:aldo/keto reductase n=1 Tax=Ignavibacterium sp. TaxID=2651167 RepID=UPI00404925A9
MIYRQFGNTDLQVSAIGFGAGEIGDYNLPDSEVDKLLNTALDLGINLIDTARGYYASEERIGKFISHRRDEFILSTKVGYGIDGYADWSYEIIIAGIDEALRIMKTNYIDIVHLHSCSKEILQRGEVIDALLEAKKKGKIKFAAYSGENSALEFAISTGKFDSIMTSVNICDQHSLNKLIPIAKEKHLGVIAKRPIANAPWKFSDRPIGSYAEEYWLRWKEMNLPQSDNWLETFLRFTVFADGIDSAIVGTTNINHLKKNIELIQKGPLDKSLVSIIKSAFKDKWNSLT